MWIRGAPLIGAVGAYGLALALDRDASDAALAKAHAALDATRPTAVNLRWALDRVRAKVAPLAVVGARRRRVGGGRRASPPRTSASTTRSASTASRCCAASRSGGPGRSRVMTHCNAGALATCGWGTAMAPLFRAHAEGLALHVWVSETRPRMQGASLTAWELDQRGIPHTLFADSASGLLMQRGDVDVVFVGADRVARNGDVCNKIGTYDKALAARDNNVPFYVALPSPTIDWTLATGDGDPDRDARQRRSADGRRPRRLRTDGARRHRAARHARRSTTRST